MGPRGHGWIAAAALPRSPAARDHSAPPLPASPRRYEATTCQPVVEHRSRPPRASLQVASTSPPPPPPAAAAGMAEPQQAPDPRDRALEELKKKLVTHREAEARVKNLREEVKTVKKEYDKTEDDLKALQSVGQIIGEVLRQLDEERCEQQWGAVWPGCTACRLPEASAAGALLS